MKTRNYRHYLFATHQDADTYGQQQHANMAQHPSHAQSAVN